MQKTIFAALILAATGFAVTANAQTVVSSDVTNDTTWSGEVVLQQPIFVRNGATLTVLPGTIVRGQPRTGPVVVGATAGTPGALIVTQTGRINAQGDRFNPIVMTTAAVDNNADGVADDDDSDGFDDAWVSGDSFLDNDPIGAPLAPLNAAGDSNVALWGGLVVLGSAPTNLADEGPGYGQGTVEGLTIPGFPIADATYGGVDPHDNSGFLRYVEVRHAGDEIGSGNELNGITLAGVGDGTVIEFVSVYANFDDGVEWFGGTVSGKNIAVFFVGDDHVDVDQGYTGINQFVFIVMPFFNENDGDNFGSRSGDKAAELDGDDFAPDAPALPNLNTRINETLTVVDSTPSPLSNSQFYNVTVIGSTPDAGQEFTPTSSASTNRGVQFRNGYAGYLLYSIVVNTGAETGVEVDTGVGDGAPGFDAVNNVANGLICVVCSTLDDGAALAQVEIDALANGDAYAQSLGGSTPASDNCVNAALFPGLVNEDQTFNPIGTTVAGRPGKLASSLKAAPIDPRPGFGFACVGGCPDPGTRSLDRSATYRGAFAAGAPLWTDDWTVLNLGGLL